MVNLVSKAFWMMSLLVVSTLSAVGLAGCIDPGGDAGTATTDLILIDDPGTGIDGGQGSTGCSTIPRHCCDTDLNNRCIRFVAGCQLCP